LGEELRSKYINESSPLYVQGINTTLYDDPQVTVQVDAGGEGDVITISSLALLSGLFPATPDYTITLANGSTIEGPLGGFQVGIQLKI
jgi:prostatic aicd phosphatase